MPNLLTLLVAIAIVGSAASLYVLKNEAVGHARKIRELNEKIERTRDEIARLRAEWLILNSPDRLKALADAHLELQPARVGDYVSVTAIPLHPPLLRPPSIRTANDHLEGELITGDIGEPETRDGAHAPSAGRTGEQPPPALPTSASDRLR